MHAGAYRDVYNVNIKVAYGVGLFCASFYEYLYIARACRDFVNFAFLYLLSYVR